MNDVKAKEHRYLQTRLVHSDVLDHIRPLRATHIQSRPEEVATDQVEMLRTKVPVPFTIELLELAQFFRESHSRHELVDSAFDVRLALLCEARSHKDQCDEHEPQAASSKFH